MTYTKPTRKTLFWLAGTLALAAALTFYLSGGKDTEARYVTATVDRADMQKSVSASGTLNPVKLVNVGTQISGVVRVLNVDYNDTVTEGQVLAELDQSLLQAQLKQSEGNLASANAVLREAQANFVRVQALVKKDYVARADLDLAQQQLDSARAQVQTAGGQVERDKVNIGYSVIRSPVSGVIISRSVDVGQTVAASFQTPTLFIIAQDLKEMQIDTSLSEADVGNVREAMPVRFTVDAYPGRSFDGKVRQIRLNPTTTQNVVTYNVVIDVTNDELILLPGMTAFVTLIEAEKPDVLRVPSSALSYRPSAPEKPAMAANAAAEPRDKNAQYVYVLRDGKPQRVRVTTGIKDTKYTEIASGELKEGDRVITEEPITVKAKPGGASGSRGGPKLF